MSSPCTSELVYASAERHREREREREDGEGDVHDGFNTLLVHDQRMRCRPYESALAPVDLPVEMDLVIIITIIIIRRQLSFIPLQPTLHQ